MADATLLTTIDIAPDDGLPPCVSLAISRGEWSLIMDLAAQLEEDHRTRVQWYIDDPIDALGGQTAAELVARGRGNQVIGFLYHAAWSGRRDGAETADEGDL
jgi:hypothetical protein